MDKKEKLRKVQMKRVKEDFGIDLTKPSIKPVKEVLDGVPYFVLAKVENNSKAVIDRHELQLKKGQVLCLPLGIYSQLKNAKGGIPILTPYRHRFAELYKKFNINDDLNNKKILIVRSGGFGDLIFTQSVAKMIKEKYPLCTINYATSPNHMQAIYLFPPGLVDSVFPIPFTTDVLKDHDYHLFFMGVIENSIEAESMNCYDLFSIAAGFGEFDPKYNPEIWINPSLKEMYYTNHPNMYNKMVIIQPRSTSIIRSMTPELLEEIIIRLQNKGNIVGLIDIKEMATGVEQMIEAFDSRIDKTRIVNLAAICPTIVHGSTVFSMVKGAITVDSAFSHICAGLKKPVVTLFGAFKGDIRMKYYETGRWIEPKDGWNECGKNPCFFHADRMHQCPFIQQKKPIGCMTTRSMDPDIIVETFEDLCKEVYNNEK